MCNATMTEQKEQPKDQKKSVWFKLQEAVPCREEQFELVSLGVRLILLTWATAMLSLSYLDLSKLGIPQQKICLLYTSPSPRDGLLSRMPSSA